MTEITVRKVADRRLSLDVDGESVMERDFDDLADLAAEAKRLLDSTDATLIRISAEGDIAPHIGMALLGAGAIVPDPWDEELPFDPDEKLAIGRDFAASGEDGDALPDEIDGAAVIGVTFDGFDFVVGDPIEDEESHFRKGADALEYAGAVVANHGAEGKRVVLVVSELAQAAMKADRERMN